MKTRIENLFIRITGYTYSNLSRLFICLFVGVMFMQFGIRQIIDYESLSMTFPTVWGMGSETCLVLMIVIELLCSALIIMGLCTRPACLPPLVSMIVAEYYILHDLLHDSDPAMLEWLDPGFLPIMFVGIYIYLLLAGPGKISLDYFIAFRIIEKRGAREEEELEEV